MPTIDIDLYDALTAANVPADRAGAAACSLERRLNEGKSDFVTNAELGAAVDRLETKIDHLEERLDAKIGNEVARLDAKIDERFHNLNIQITMIKWFMGIQVGVTLGILWALMRLLR